MPRVAILVFIASAFVAMWVLQRAAPGPKATPPVEKVTVVPNPFAAMPAADLIVAGQAVQQRWAADIKKGKFYSGDEAELDRIRYALTVAKMSPSDRTAANEVLAAMRKNGAAEQSIRAKQEADALAANFSPRRDFATTIEENFLKRGFDVVMKTSGDNHQTLTMRYILMNRPFLYQIVNETDFLQNCKRLGFKQIVFTNGYDDTWRYDVAKNAFR